MQVGMQTNAHKCSTVASNMRCSFRLHPHFTGNTAGRACTSASASSSCTGCSITPSTQEQESLYAEVCLLAYNVQYAWGTRLMVLAVHV